MCMQGVEEILRMDPFPPTNRSNKMIGNGILKVYKMIGNASLHNLCDNVLLFGMAPTKTH